ncbi:MAG: STAS domain-containing protein [Methanolinea sp.]|jgi:anti-sigma B factor antagonist
MQISSVLKDGILVLSLEGRLDSLGALDLGEYLKQHLKETDRTAVFDMEAVPYLSSAGIRTIISAEKMLKGRNGRLHLSRVQPYPLSVLEMTGFSTLLSLHPTCEDAVLAARATVDRAGHTGDASPVSYTLKGADFLVTRTGTDKGVLEITGIHPRARVETVMKEWRLLSVHCREPAPWAGEHRASRPAIQQFRWAISSLSARLLHGCHLKAMILSITSLSIRNRPRSP